MYNIIQKRKIWFTFSSILVVISLLAFMIWGLNLGIDFTGGSIIELKFSNYTPSNEEIISSLSALDQSTINIQSSSDNTILIRTISLNESDHQILLKSLNKFNIEGENSFEELRFDSIGPIIGQELKQKAIYSIFIVLLAIIFYIAYTFRKVSRPVESWKYGISAIIALAHDIIIITGIFAILGRFMDVQIDSYFVTALLTVLGFSVHDTIVTFDRTRENLPKHQDKTFLEVVNLSVNETIVRSLNTSFTTFIVLLSIFLFGGATIKYFVLALMLGAIIGTYSSIFLASPLLMVWYKFKKY